MCILATATAGAQFTRDTLESMFRANPDGAGWAYAKCGKIYFSKGYTSASKFIKAVQKLPLSVERMVHCRIATHGGVCRELTHPFPVSTNYGKMEMLSGTLSSGYILAHNGILSNFTPPKNHSDTEELVRCLANVKSDIMDEGMRDIIDLLIEGSRVAILNTDGKIKRYGTGWTFDNGIYYSNTYFKWRNTYYNVYNYDDDWDDYAYRGYYSYATKEAKKTPTLQELTPLEEGEVVKLPTTKRAFINVTEGSYLLDKKTNKLYGHYNGVIVDSNYCICSDYNCGACDYNCPFKDCEDNAV